jgi:hypothetical protein
MERTSLFPVAEVPEMLPETDLEETKYKRSVKWDAQLGDFARDSAGRLIGCSGEEAYQTWCLKTVQTPRYQCLAYPNEIGVEMEDALQGEDYEDIEDAIEQTITDALLVNPRSEQVQDFDFVWDGDTVECSFSVQGVGQEEFQIEMEVE